MSGGFGKPKMGRRRRSRRCWKETIMMLGTQVLFKTHFYVSRNRVIPNQFIIVWKHLSLPCLCLCLGLHPQKACYLCSWLGILQTFKWCKLDLELFVFVYLVGFYRWLHLIRFDHWSSLQLSVLELRIPGMVGDTERIEHWWYRAGYLPDNAALRFEASLWKYCTHLSGRPHISRAGS